MRNPDHVRRIESKMRERRLTAGEIEAFLRMVARIDGKSRGYIDLNRTATPTPNYVMDSKKLEDEIPALEERGKKLLNQTVIIKLNGGRSTSMGGFVPKGILAAKNGRSYLDIIAGQIQAFRKQWNVEVPLVLMNSFFTDNATAQITEKFPFKLITFIQHQAPRLYEDSLTPLDRGTDEDWAPPGHGDIYESISRSGLLDNLLNEGKRWAFISNLDNLAACLDPWIIGLLDRDGSDFLLEVTDRTRADRKGGTLVLIDGGLELLEIAQVKPDERELFQDIERFKVFNTNNVWINLEALKDALKNGSLDLPLIQNHKTIHGKKIIQLETAMGAAIGHFPRARGLRVSRDRFFPTKRVGDLFLLQSDVCILDSMDRLQRNPVRPKSLPLRPRVFFGSDFLDFPHELPDHFEDPSTVSLLFAHTLEVSGPVFFERNVRIEGEVSINAAGLESYRIRRNAVLKDGTYP